MNTRDDKIQLFSGYHGNLNTSERDHQYFEYIGSKTL